MQTQDQTITIIYEAPDARLYKLLKNVRTKLSQSPVRLCWYNSAQVYFLGVEQFCQNLYPTTPLVTMVSEKGVTLLFPNIAEGLNGIFIPGPPSQIFCQHLGQIIQLIPYANAIQIPQFKSSIDLHCKEIEKLPLDSDLEAVSVISQGGEAAKKGFMWLGNVMAEGVNKGGQFINSKIDKQEKVQVSTETKIKYAVAKQTASQTAQATGSYLSQLFKPVVDTAKGIHKDINKKIDESSNQTLKDGRQIAVASWDATGNALSGLGQALSQVGDSVGTNTKQCVEKRYGQDVTNTFISDNQPYGNMIPPQDLYMYQQQYQGHPK